MTNLKKNYKSAFFTMLILVLCILMSSLCAAMQVLAETSSQTESQTVTQPQRVTMLDLMARYPIDYVLGPVDVNDTNGDGEIDRKDLNEYGKFSYKSDNYERDSSGNPVEHTCQKDCRHQTNTFDGVDCILTNNIYGIAADKYFDVESYIYTTGTKDSDEGRTLYGWEKNIRARTYVSDVAVTPVGIAENGELLNGRAPGDEEAPISIYVQYPTNGNQFGTSIKYALIVPNDITKVGQGSAAFVAKNASGVLTSYYQDKTVTDSNDELFSDFTDFASFITGDVFSYNAAPYFWQPRERLAGVYFDERSRLQTIESSEATRPGFAGRSETQDVNKSAFKDCNNLRFMILPNGLNSIGSRAFAQCEHVVDINIPSSVTELGDYAFDACHEILHISVPSGLSNTTAFNGCSKLAQYTGSTLYVMAGAPENGVLDSGRSGFLFAKTNNRWTATAFAGETGEAQDKVFIFPDSSDFATNSDRRRAVEYDYLDCDGIKCKNTFDNGEDVEYDVAASFAKNTWCRNVVLPKACTEIGAQAFYNSRVMYLETYAKTIGANAFTNENNDGGEQWYYIHQAKEGNAPYTSIGYNVASSAFAEAKGTRHIVFEDYDLYAAFGYAAPTWLQKGSYTVHYQIPVIANVFNEDALELTLNVNDMQEKFFNDADYIKAQKIVDGQNSLTYTKKLSGYSFDNAKQKTGGWQQETDAVLIVSSKNPTLSNMTDTVWYSNSSYTGESVTAATGYSSETPPTGAINIYTRNIARPENIKSKAYDGTYRGKYTFGQEYTFGIGAAAVVKKLGDDVGANNPNCIDFNTVLGLSSDYNVVLTRFVYPDGVTSATETTKNLRHAGNYSFAVKLNPKWGVWSEEFINSAANSGYFTASAEVKRQQIDFSSIDNIPQFMNGTGTHPLNGDSVPLYRYNDGWYLSEQTGKDLIEIRKVTNAYFYYTEKNGVAENKKIQIAGEKNIDEEDGSSQLGDFLVVSRNGLESSLSADYIASFTFQVKYIKDTTQSDYVFYYGANADTKYQNISDEKKGLSITQKQDFSFRVTKHWYIVKETNMFTLVAQEASAYSPVYKRLTESGATHDVAYDEWTYSDNEIKVRNPELRFGNYDNGVGTDEIYFEISYTPVNGNSVTIKERGVLDRAVGATGVDTLGYYINSAMPAGTYELKLSIAGITVGSGGSAQTYDPMSGTYTLTVLPKAFEENKVRDIFEKIRGEAVEDGYVNSYPLGVDKKLHDAISTEKAKLEGTLESQPMESNNYWATSAAGLYYDDQVSILYNLEGSGNTDYISYDAMLAHLGTANVYVLYYSISAKNYIMVGGADSANRQQWTFTTILYTDIKISDFYRYIQSSDGLYFQNVVYTGSAAYTRVPASEFFGYSFNDDSEDLPETERKNYIDVRERASVTLTLYNATLARWNRAGISESEFNKYFKFSDDGAALIVYYDIVRAGNSWLTPPQLNGWSYGGFTTDTNTVVGTLAYPSEDGAMLDVYYRVGALVGGAYEWKNVGGTIKVNGKVDSTYFKVDANGRVSDDVAEVLNGLHCGTYYLGYYVTARSDGNVGVFTAEIGFTQVVVSRATNTWSAPPSIVRWTWDEYDSDINVLTSGTKFNSADEFGVSYEVVYTITKAGESSACSVDITSKDGGAKTVTLENFTLVDDDVVKALKLLPAGDYVLWGLQKGNGDYKDIPLTSFPFNIGVATGGFSTTPSVINWVFGEFNRSTNFIEAESAFSSYGETVSYGVYLNEAGTESYSESSTGLTATAMSALMKSLKAGTYYLRADAQRVDATQNNVSSSPIVKVFVISEFTNGWEVAPAFTDSTSFKYGGMQSDLTPKAARGDVEYILDDVKYTSYSNLVAQLNALDAGNAEHTLIIEVDGVVGEYTGIPAKSYKITVLRTDNDWDVLPSVSGYIWGTENASLGVTEGVPVFNKNDLGITRYFYKASLNPITGEYDRGDALSGAPSDAGTYMYVTTIPASGNYDTLVGVHIFTIAPATNLWKYESAVSEFVNPDGSIKDGSNIGWTWSDFSSWTCIKAKYGTTFYTINGQTSSSEASLNEQFGTLNAGTYTLYVSTDSGNWTGLNVAITVKVDKVPNGWSNREPSIDKTIWEYNTTAGVISNVSADWGTVVTRFYTRAGLLYGDGTQMPTAVGQYTVKFRVDSSDTDNWGAVEEFPINFEITQATDKSFVVQPSATGWVYGEYKRDVNLFSAIPTTRGVVTFSVLYNDQVVVVDGVRLENIGLDKDGLVSADVASLLAKLEGGSSVDANARTYVLKVSVAGTTNYKEFDSSVSFTVSAARNEWVVTPQVSPWAVHQWTAVSTPQAVSLFGVAHIEIKSQYGSSIYYSADYDSVSDTTTITINRLQDATAGWYILTATVSPHSGQYNNELSQDIVFQIFIQGLTSPDNHWVEIPSIVGWTANENGADGVNLPNGSPLRGTTYFVFYKAKLVNDVYQPDEDAEVTAANGILIKADSSDFVGKDYYVPYEPGYYVLKAYVIFYNAEGEPVDEDGLDPEFVPFEIRMRVNSFVDEPRIETLLYLGDRAAWSLPTAKSLEGSVTYTYKLQDSDDEPTTEMPNKPGKYLLIATASAKYCEDIVRTVKFTVELSPNSWLSAPIIKDWSEETGPNDPFGEAAVGSENITYTYASAKDPSKILTEKPTAEGSYIMYATLEMEGYETITAEYAFIIESAWDTQLLLIDIILGLVVCACTIVVIIFAIRRYKEC